MRKYIWKRIFFSLLSLLAVVWIVMLLVYSLTDRSAIFQTDDVWNKRSNNDRVLYEYTQYQKYGYLEFVNFTSYSKAKWVERYGEQSYDKSDEYLDDKNIIQRNGDAYLDNETVKEFIRHYTGKGYKIVRLEPIKYSNGRVKPGGAGYLLATKERMMILRLLDYVKGLITIETRSDVKDESLTDRYIRFEKDPYGGFALVGSGTTHKYLVYFDGNFPFMHWNWIHLNLGVSFTRYRGQEISGVITESVGDLKTERQQFPLQVGTDVWVDTAANMHSLTYNSGEITETEKAQFPDRYTVYTYKRSGLSMIGNSFVIGLVATIIQYMIGIPLGILMARKKDGLWDNIGMFYIIFIQAVPTLAYIFIFAAIGTSFGLPYKFANATVKILAYVLPTLSLALSGIAGLMKWMRRYMIDQMNSDYVKFARAEGLSEREIYSIHISRNAVIPIVHNIPANILGCLIGAIITETVYSVPGVGSLLTKAINGHDNGIIIACTVFYTTLSLISMILGDILISKVDPRISFESKGGR